MLDLYPKLTPGPPRPSRILTPTGFARHSGIERHSVPGGGALVLTLRQGDKITVLNDEGGQACEMIVADTTGRIAPDLCGLRANSTADGLKAMLTSGGSGLAKVRQGLTRRGIDLAKAGAVRFFGPDTAAQTTETFTATADATLIIAAPGPAMNPGEQNTTTALTVTITRANPGQRATYDLPDPLADPGLDLRIASATASAYHVKAGDYIQIIDVDGRQCTDFQAFSARKLEKGIEHPLDVIDDLQRGLSTLKS